VREQFEWDLARLPGALHVPLADVPAALYLLSAHDEIVVYCKSGRRSQQAAEQLVAAGAPSVLNLAGGILRWGEEVDPSIPRY
jgi:rhodanese-related sulfurtransferase